ncbi:hypothetical protein, partial [uncultured Alistipes sp.]|uniref:hypothetical protein n=1 Tax=uncultured Alistipes sp. TaxID=538949 RepID=UPI00262C9718
TDFLSFLFLVAQLFDPFMSSDFFSQQAPPKPQVGIIHDFYIYMRSTAGLGCFCGGEMQGNLLLPPLIPIFAASNQSLGIA